MRFLSIFTVFSKFVQSQLMRKINQKKQNDKFQNIRAAAGPFPG